MLHCEAERTLESILIIDALLNMTILVLSASNPQAFDRSPGRNFRTLHPGSHPSLLSMPLKADCIEGACGPSLPLIRRATPSSYL
jgi:hypothetical protein